ncbi:molybdate ABC transporter substrate-binding protein [Undibacterium rugosum]|uniref:molybdate ABC transporter substrate-binding protein n=1 Tax=Undibacterium rugosum TaxID=2762291 RepID=UPI001E2FB5DF|nr:molybdate ABC transporter substrate-binding protein [Undibacterium rugosum]
MKFFRSLMRSSLCCALFFSVAVQAETLSVAVAANVQFVFDDLKAAFKQDTGHELQASFNSSGKFVAQISNGAPFDVFLSADMEFPEKLHKDGYAMQAPKVYAYGALVLWTMKDLDLQQWQAALQQARVSKIAMANPKTAPYGREAMRVLSAYQLEQSLQPRLVFAESIAQTNQYIHSGVADLGFTAKSVVLSPEMKGQGKWLELPRDVYQPIAQGAVILKHGKEQHAAVSQQFYDFIYSAKARAIFARYGYILP